MREIKFRARALADNEIIYFRLHQTVPHMKDGHFFVGDVLCWGGTEEQYIGLKDKNNKEIYENDIGRVYSPWTKSGETKYEDREKLEYKKNKEHEWIAVVKYGDWGDITCHSSYGWYCDAIESQEIYGWQMPQLSDGDFEVIGNTIDNPDLVKGQNEK